MRLKLITPFLAAAVLGVCAQAQTLLIDRGLPTANLNNAAGANRSNVAWSDATYLVGDSAEVGGNQTYNFTKLRLWTIQSGTAFNYFDASNYELFLGVGDYSNTNLALTPAALTITSVNYTGGADYELPAGGFRDLIQLDFTINVNAYSGQVLFFALNGKGAFNPASHASNAALSGSTQDAADDFILLWDPSDLSNWGGVQTGGSSWDKNSDINVQVWGSTVPEPSTYGMIGAAVLAGLVVLRRRRA